MTKEQWFRKQTEEAKFEAFTLMCKKVAELEKANAALKAKNNWYSEQVCNKECAEVWGKLTKAKEIIGALLNVFVYDMAEETFDAGQLDLRDKVEDFLKEE